MDFEDQNHIDLDKRIWDFNKDGKYCGDGKQPQIAMLKDGTYAGDVENYKPHGYGKLKFNNGDYYEGWFKEG